jgi:hypothetical protein
MHVKRVSWFFLLCLCFGTAPHERNIVSHHLAKQQWPITRLADYAGHGRDRRGRLVASTADAHTQHMDLDFVYNWQVPTKSPGRNGYSSAIRRRAASTCTQTFPNWTGRTPPSWLKYLTL